MNLRYFRRWAEKAAEQGSIWGIVNTTSDHWRYTQSLIDYMAGERLVDLTPDEGVLFILFAIEHYQSNHAPSA